MSPRKFQQQTNNNLIWPGFVDALSGLLLVVIFLLIVFFLSQFILNQFVNKKDEALDFMVTEMQNLSTLLSFEKESNEKFQAEISSLTASLLKSQDTQGALTAQVNTLESQLVESEQKIDDLEVQYINIGQELNTEKENFNKTMSILTDKNMLIDELEQALTNSEMANKQQKNKIIILGENIESQLQLTNESQLQLKVLNKQTAELRAQLTQLQSALDVSEVKNKEQKIQIASLGQRLNTALASKVQELQTYRSQFFGSLRRVLGDEEGIRIIGDRFIFQSEVLFDSGSASLGEEGRKQLFSLAKVLLDISQKIPKDIPWLLRIDGHTDAIPIYNEKFKDNWTLSTARALSVVDYLISQNIPPQKLAATGFGEFHPLEKGTDEISLRRNRRIEIKLTQ